MNRGVALVTGLSTALILLFVAWPSLLVTWATTAAAALFGN
jgi:hypothetical protein